MADYHIREAAESLLCSVSSPPYRNTSHSQSVNLMSEDLVAGYRPPGKMSSVRRFFCLFVTFDILFTSLMWLICVMMKGESLIQIFNREIIHYDIKISLFDIVIVAVLRFLLLIVFYAIVYINNWSVIALSTSGTCAFLIGKVFVYDWPNASQPVYQVFLILTSFTIAWGEAWFLDFRVLPQELQAKQILETMVSQSTERTPLLGPQRPHRVQSTHGESTVNWFSPVETPESSPRPKRPGDVILTQDQIDEYKQMAEEGMQNAWRTINLPDWKLEKRGSQKGDIVESKQCEQFGKVYRFTGIVDCPAKFLFEEFKNNITKLPEWNPTILKSELIKEIGPGIDLSYQVTAGGGRGIIAPRDFVILRRLAPLGPDGRVVEAGDATCYITSGVSVAVPGYPPARDMVRGHNKVGCWCLTPKAVEEGGKVVQRTVFQWLMCCDLKGKIPQFVLDAAFATVMLDYIVHVRKFAADSKAKGLF
ncbi:steroidogenic acute regulatory protein-like [Vanessa atalanta]|uniref:steroidogenic acute regulatory protein-like n=1 Tax=Vanessa atalanta TaxID=42275 RepID=UPI001FCD6A63|nr:steroidogenic acute regulatory protein-like [Vanessa atalanta]XP_047541490.1 steroidogenic acute regulatory protein-like [Vanessa atalanta]